MVRKAVWIIGVLAVGVAIGGYVFFGGERKVPIRYKTAPVERGSIISVVNATGTINPVTMVQVGSQRVRCGGRGGHRRTSVTLQ